MTPKSDEHSFVTVERYEDHKKACDIRFVNMENLMKNLDTKFWAVILLSLGTLLAVVFKN